VNLLPLASIGLARISKGGQTGGKDKRQQVSADDAFYLLLT